MLSLTLPQHARTFNLSAGKLILVRGPNGAGKSTLLKTLLGFHVSDAHQYEWVTPRPKVFYLSHELPIKPGFTILHYCQWHPMVPPSTEAAIMAALKGFNLQHKAFAMTHQLSRGERQRLLLACAELSQASVWFLDEPLTNLDTQHITLVEQWLKAAKQEGKAIMVVSHQPLTIEVDEVIDVG